MESTKHQRNNFEGYNQRDRMIPYNRLNNVPIIILWFYGAFDDLYRQTKTIEEIKFIKKDSISMYLLVFIICITVYHHPLIPWKINLQTTTGNMIFWISVKIKKVSEKIDRIFSTSSMIHWDILPGVFALRLPFKRRLYGNTVNHLNFKW